MPNAPGLNRQGSTDVIRKLGAPLEKENIRGRMATGAQTARAKAFSPETALYSSE